MKNKSVVKYGIGADMSKKTFHGCIKSEMNEGSIKVVATKKFNNTKSGHKAFYDWIEKNRKDKDVSYQVVIEVTGIYHENLVYYLYDHGISVSVEMPKRVKRYLESIGQDSKTDKLDSKGLAQMACERKMKKWEPCSKNIRELRALLRHRKSLIKSKTQFNNQLHAIEHSSLTGKEVKNSLKVLIKKIDRQIKQVEKEVLIMAKEDEELYEKAKMISDSVSGAAMLTVLTVVSETNGFKDFNSQKQLESYAGFDIVENSSGNHVGKTKISKKGNVHLRAIMYMPALSVVTHKTLPYYNLYERLVKRNGGLKKKALVAVQRKLLVLIYTLWKKNEAFDVNYENKKREELNKSELKKVVPI